MRVAFMGTPAFAVPALTALLNNSNYSVVAAYTKAPKAAGRGLALIKSPVHICAEKACIPVFTPSTLKSQQNLEELEKLTPDVIVVSAYGLILPEAVLNVALHGCINIHPSDLPRWRGAAPIQRTILSGDRCTALCIMKMDAGLDTGEVILRHPVALNDTITATELSILMADLSALKLVEALDLIRSGCATFTRQANEGVTYANKLSREEEKITWNKNAFDISCQIRAFSPRPGAYFQYKGEIIKIIETSYSTVCSGANPGTVIDDKLTVSCANGTISPKLLQREGKKMLYTEAFLRGFQIKAGTELL